MKRLLSFLLSLVMVVSMLPVHAFAQTDDGVCENHLTHTDCGYIPAVQGVSCDHVCGEGCTATVTNCIHVHEDSGCTWVDAVEAISCGHTCGDGSCGYRAPVAEVVCTCTPELRHSELCASAAGEACDCTPLTAHQESCAPTQADPGQACDFKHTDCGCAAAIPGHWDCGHSCSQESGCVKQRCTHSCSDGTCGFVQGSDGSECTHKCGLCDPQLQPAVKTVEAWTWLDPEEYLTKGELAIPGANAEQIVSYERILTFLPTAIVTESYGQIAVTFSCDAYPEEGAYSGSYTFTAALPEGYVLAEGAAPLTVPVNLGNGMTLADGTTWDGSTVATAFAGGSGTSSDPYQIATCGQLAFLANQLRINFGSGYNNYASKYYILTADLNMNNKLFDGIAYFTGNFNGNGHTISGLYLYGQEDVGLFGYVEGGNISNLTVRGSVSHTGSGYTVDHGGIVAYGTGTITNCKNYCTVTGGQSVGGIAGSWRGDITNCENYGTITGVLATGGIAGRYGTTTRESMTMQGCRNYGAVSGKTETGGIIGSLLDTHTSQVTAVRVVIKQCANLAKVDGTKRVGGVIGYSEGGGIEQCANVGNVSAGGVSSDYYNGNYVGGIVGYMMLQATSAGAPEYSAGYLRDCYNAGTIISDYGIGGIAGMAMGSSVRNLDVKRVYNVGKLYSNEGSMNTTYEPGRIDSASSGNLYYMEGKNTSVKVEVNAVALTETQMHTLSNFSGFTTSVWKNGDNTYPYPVITALGVLTVAGCPHRYTNYVSNNNATCKANGTKTAQCDLGCGQSSTTTDYGSKLPHSYGEWEKVDDTNHKHSCTNVGCGYTETKPHEWDDGVVTKEPTTQTEGTRTYTCSLCDAVRTEDIEKLPDTSPKAAIDFEKEVLSGLVPNGTYTVNGEQITAGTDGTAAIDPDWVGKDISIVKKGTAEGESDSDAQTLTVPGRPAAPATVAAVGETVHGVLDGKLTGVTSAMEYRNADNGSWTAITGTQVTGLAPGSYEVRLKATNTAFAGTAAALTVTQGTVVVESVTINTDTLRLQRTEKSQLVATVLPGDAANKTVSWSSSDPSVVTVDADGLVTPAGKLGTATITATSVNGIRDTCQVTVYAKAEVSDFTVTPPTALEYDGTAKKPAVTLPEWLDASDVTVTYFDENKNPVAEPKDAGTYSVTIDVRGSAYLEAVQGMTSEDWVFTIEPAEVAVAIAPIAMQRYTGKAIEPELSLTFSGLPQGKTLTLGKDYKVTYTNNTAAGEASARVEDIAGGNYTVVGAQTSFTIAYAVKLDGHETVTDGAVVYVDGVSTTLDGDILWLTDPDAGLITTHSYHNAGAQDVYTIYPTGTFVWQLTFREETGYTAERLTELDNIMMYAGTSIRITGNQGIRFITSVPEAQKQALAGAGLAGYKLVEYGTLMGWAKNGTDLLYGVNAKSVAYDRDSGTDMVFNRADGMVQYTGMLTNLELEQSTENLVTRPYMVLERMSGEGAAEQVVLYGGSLVRSIGYVAYQNKDVYTPGNAAYEFIWKILSYAYPDLYEAEYGK